MGLAKNVYRRQATYWWRRRFADPSTGRSTTIAISLKVRRPDAARRIADALNAGAHAVARRLEARMSSIESARHELTGIVETFTWVLDADAAAALDMLEARDPRAPRDEVALTRDQEHDLLRDMKREAEAELARSAATSRLQHAAEGIRDPRQEAIVTELAFAVVFEAIARDGAAAALDMRRRTALTQRFGVDTVGFIEREIGFHATREATTRWSLGPPRGYFEDKIRAIGVTPTNGMIRLLRHDYLVLFAALLERAERRHGTPAIDTILRDLDIEPAADAPAPTPVRAPTAPVSPSPAIAPSTQASGNERPPVPATSAACPIPTPIPTPTETSILAHVEVLIRQRVRSKSWHEKTGRQHRSVGRLLVKVVGVDDARILRQMHVGEFRTILDDLPKNWGKSPSDGERTIEEICARAQDLDESEVGLSPGTIDRQLTQLSTILAYLRGFGFETGDVTASMRTGGATKARGVFTLDELGRLFRSPVYTGCAGAADRLSAGTELICDALYWVPILGYYLALRLSEACGLSLDDIDFELRVIIIRDNGSRTLKTACSHRRMPLPPELVRLGFLDYCAAIRRTGSKLVFPCLQKRGNRTPLANFFYKDFKKILDAILPYAAHEQKSFHSFRKGANTAMANGNVNDPIRHSVMGHAHSGTNERHYLEAVYDEPKRIALQTIPIVTGHLAPFAS